jgi:hypothetical protein
VPGKIKTLLGKIREVGVPQKVTAQWLKSIGFRSSNDATLIGILKYIRLTDSSGVPTSRWTQYRGANHKTVLGAAVREGYAELFAVYPDANQRSQQDLEHVFSTSSSGGRQVISKTVATFKALADQGEFSAVGEQTDLHMSSGPLHTPAAPHGAALAATAATAGVRTPGPALHIDIQIHISPEASADQIDQIFASMAKHLYGGKKSE